MSRGARSSTLRRQRQIVRSSQACSHWTGGFSYFILLSSAVVLWLSNPLSYTILILLTYYSCEDLLFLQAGHRRDDVVAYPAVLK
jgi:hypothetical protein